MKLQVTGNVKRLNSILHDESRKTAPHACMQYACSTQIFIIVTKLAISAEDEAVTDASAHFFHLLINGETENVLDSKIFARSLIDLVRRSRGVGEKGQADLLERLFEICAKIRIDPDLLPAWFYPERRLSPSGSEIENNAQPPRRSASIARQDEFPLFYILLDFVHNDGSSGDFARTGLLYLIETTSKSQNLEKWIIESDLAAQMASGLGALYSRLSRAPASQPQGEMFSPSTDDEPTRRSKDRHRMPGEFDDIVNDSDESSDEEPDEAMHNVHSFLSYLAFWQDTLNHCSSSEVADTLLDHFQILFVQQLLYPSLLESSDMDGGSTAAVVAHLYRILDSLEHKDMLQRILDYLLSSHQQRPSLDSNKRRPRMSISRRKSMDKLAAMTQSHEDPSPDLFNLLDLITLSLKSSRPQTNTAALKLVSMMLRKHHDQVFATLFKLQPCDKVLQTREIFHQELILLFRAAMDIMDTPRIDQSYQVLLQDVQFMLNEHCCDLSIDEEGLLLTVATPRCFKVQKDCRLTKTVSDLFRTFFANETMTNVALTETVVSLASCKFITLRGWLIRNTDESTRSDSPNILDILDDQVAQVNRWRSHFLKWDELFSLQQEKLMSTPTSVSMPKSPQRSSFDRPMSPMGLGISNASPKSVIGSHLRGPKTDSSIEGNTDATDLEHLLRMLVELPQPEQRVDTPTILPSLAERLGLEPPSMLSSTPSEGMSSGAATPSFPESSTRSSATLSHVLSNVIILQEFLLEIAAVIQVRASLFGEVEAVSKE